MREDISHSFWTGYPSRAKILLQRSFDHGETWLREHDVVVWDETLPLEEKRAILQRADEPGVAREQIDLTGPDAAVYFARPVTGPTGSNGEPTLECFAFRSGDRGRTWEAMPTRVSNPHGGGIHRDAHPLVQFPDGTLMGVMTMAMTPERDSAGMPGGVGVFGSDDNGLTWEYVAEVARDPTGVGRPTYAGLLLLPGGRLQCYMLNIGGIRNAIQLPTPMTAAQAGAAPGRLWRGGNRRGRGGVRRRWPGAVSITARRGRCGCGMGGLWCSSGGASHLPGSG